MLDSIGVRSIIFFPQKEVFFEACLVCSVGISLTCLVGHAASYPGPAANGSVSAMAAARTTETENGHTYPSK